MRCRELFAGEEPTSIERQIVNGSINKADMEEWREREIERGEEREIEFRVVGEQSPSVG